VEPYVIMIARLAPKPEKADELRKILQNFIGPTRAEAGCVAYHLHWYEDHGTVFAFYEVWRSQADLDEHMKTPYISAFMERELDLLRKPVEIERMNMLSDFSAGRA
jgi:quinol monooxygenase YgiN